MSAQEDLIEKYIKAVSDGIEGCVAKDGQICLSGRFQQLQAIIKPSSRYFFEAGPGGKRVMHAMREHLAYAQDDWLALFKVCALIEYMESAYKEDKNLGSFCMSSLEIAVSSFHTEMRSLMDYIGMTCLYLADGSSRRDVLYFKDTFKQLSSSSDLEPNMAAIVDCLHRFKDYYSSVTTVRNAMVHQGAKTHILLNSDWHEGRTALLIGHSGTDLVSEEHFEFPSELFSEPATDLNIFIGLCLGRLIQFMNELADKILTVLEDRHIIVLTEFLFPNHPSTMAKLVVAGNLPASALQLMTDQVPGEPIILSHRMDSRKFVIGTSSALSFLDEALETLQKWRKVDISEAAE